MQNELHSNAKTFTVAGYLLGADKPLYALALVALIIPQVIFQVKQATSS